MVEDVAEKAAIADVMRIDEDMRYFLVGFKNGDVLGVFPKKITRYTSNDGSYQSRWNSRG